MVKNMIETAGEVAYLYSEVEDLNDQLAALKDLSRRLVEEDDLDFEYTITCNVDSVVQGIIDEKNKHLISMGAPVRRSRLSTHLNELTMHENIAVLSTFIELKQANLNEVNKKLNRLLK